jgi:DNA topoisomerase-3
MSKILIIAEKPSVASKISQALQSSNKKKKDGYIEDDKYIISWCLGHLFEQKKPSEVDETYKTWSLNTLPFKFDKIPNQVRDDKGCKAQVKALVNLLKRDDVTEVVDACDADREGEGINNFRNIISLK